MTATRDVPQTREETRRPDRSKGRLTRFRSHVRDWRQSIRTKPGMAQAWPVAVFVVGLLLIALGVGLAVLPGPLTIPPILLGLWVWSTEFAWAHRLLAPFKKKAKDAWAHGKRRPVSSTLVTIGGLAAAAVAFWAIGHYQLLGRVEQLLGL